MKQNAQKILDVVNESRKHLTAEEIFFSLKKSGNAMSLATVYNNLKKLVQDEQIRKITVEGKTGRYDRNKPHDHLLIRSTGELEDYEFRDLTEELSEQLGRPILGYDLKVFVEDEPSIS
ncbi:MAG: transcriptional repressor [Peptoniphilaceae bacterium]|nr:transcriptional repressor [Peptoniphilaceae bacterium]MCI6660329.1 transcriptional repressor [Peptoniphilaceae bacterium]MDD7433860.1 transcriptional repressor [Peptoniphilaceae bacterium]MDY3075169.1 transcriptional repressor [Peptoniphilaceae bacterium]MDY3987591.1 transcriptional repressor [Peptoniphilaceae bacterium]